MIRKYLMVSVSALLSVISIGCVESAPFQRVPDKYVPNFSYTPSSQGVADSAGVTFTVGSLSYKSAPKALWFTYPQFADLDKAIQQDLSKLLTAKGFSLRGPFASYDLIPYPDKKVIDLWMAPTMGLSITFKDHKSEIESIWESPIVGIFTGNVEVSGSIILELREIVTHELMWRKSIPLTKFEFPYSIRGSYNEYNDFIPFVMNDVAKGIEQQYPDLMATIFKLIDPEEMRIIKKQAQELKSKKGY